MLILKMSANKTFFGSILICFSIILMISLYSYSNLDNCLSTLTVSETTLNANLLGSFGAYTSDIFIQCFGMFSFLIASLMFVWGWNFITDNIHIIKHKSLAFIFFTIIGCVIFTVLSTKSAMSFIMQKFNIVYLAGGFVGYVITKLLFVDLIKNANIGMFVFVTLCVLWLFIFKRVFFISLTRIKDGAPKIFNSIKKLNMMKSKKKSPKNEHVWKKVPHMDGLANSVRFTDEKIDENEEIEQEVVHDTDEKVVYQAATIMGGGGTYTMPHIELLDRHNTAKNISAQDDAAIAKLSQELCGVLNEFGVNGEIINVRQGPVVTMFEFRPAAGIKTSRVISLSDDIARSMSAISARISIIPGQNAIGIELPNKIRQTVYLREMLTSEQFIKFSNGIPLILGKDISGNPIVADLAKMPHLLVAGTTGSGKSVSINDMILSILFKFGPDECKLIMIDPKMLELSVYDEIPHLLTPVVTDPKKAVFALKWAVSEMENRYRQMSKLGVRNIDGFNKKLKESKEKGDLLVRKVQTGFDQDTGRPIFETQQLEFETIPYIVIIVDEMADLMLVAGKDIEMTVQRLAQMARAAGIHLIMATQRPSVDVITGTIKANFPTRISFQVTSKIDSRTILGEQGAEQLLGQGDMLYMVGGGRIMRIHGPFVKDVEVERIVGYIKGQGEPSYVDVISDTFGDDESFKSDFGGVGQSGVDDMYQKALEVIQNDKKVSISYIQRKLQIGYNRAARIIEEMEQKGVISPPNHTGKREILI